MNILRFFFQNGFQTEKSQKRQRVFRKNEARLRKKAKAPLCHPIPRARATAFVVSALACILLYSGCTVKRELTGENDNEVKALLDQIAPLLQLQRLSKGLELVNLLNDIQKLTNATTTTETDDAYPGSAPGVSNTTGACYIDNKGGVAGFDLCCYAIIETECANVASVLLTNYDITFVAGANTAAACTGNGFTTAYNSSSFSCYLK